MPSLTLEDRLIWFAHCPKAGGTSVEEVMVARWGDRVGHLHWGWDLWWKRGGWRVADPPNSPQHLTWEDAQAILPVPPDAVFALVRDPASRMISEYRFQRHQRRGTHLGRALSFLPFAIWLRLMLAMARRHPFAFDNHFRPQSAFIPAHATVFRLEEGLGPVLDWLGVEAPAPPHRLKSGAGPVRLGAGERGLIGQAYAEDYARFGYPVPTGTARRGPLDILAESLAPPLVWLDRSGRL